MSGNFPSTLQDRDDMISSDKPERYAMVYPDVTEGVFKTKPRQHTAKRWDGSTAEGYRMLGWLYDNGFAGSLEDGSTNQGPDVIHVWLKGEEDEKKRLVSNSWVVIEEKHVIFYSDAEFWRRYDII